MKKFATYPCIIVVFLFNLSTSCTTDGAVDFSFNWPEIIIPLPTLDSVQVTVWTKPDITFWSQWESADSLKNAETSLMFSSYSNTIEQMAYVRTTDKADTPHLLPYNIAAYGISLTSYGNIHISETYKDTTGSFTDLINTLEFRGFVIPSQKWSSALDYNDYNAVCKFYNVQP